MMARDFGCAKSVFQKAVLDIGQRVRSARHRPLSIELVRRTPKERLLNSLIEMHHYLGYTEPVGEQMKYLVFAGDRPVACFTFSSAARHLGPRDRFVSWPKEERRRNIRFIAYNSRFLILPWVQVPHLASHLLGKVLRRLVMLCSATPRVMFRPSLPTAWRMAGGNSPMWRSTFPRTHSSCWRNWARCMSTTPKQKRKNSQPLTGSYCTKKIASR